MGLFLTFNDIFVKSFMKYFSTYLEVLCSHFADVITSQNVATAEVGLFIHVVAAAPPVGKYPVRRKE